MKPVPIDNYVKFKTKFSRKLNTTLTSYPCLNAFMCDMRKIDENAYVVGGYLRDIASGSLSRDIDIITPIKHQELMKLVQSHNILHTVNRHNGIKLIFDDFQTDIWSIRNNWAFNYEVVKLNENNVLESIANGCFYNYDALVMNINTLDLNVRHYNEWAKSNTLEIIQRSDTYKRRNPTAEANVLRALYIFLKYDSKLSENCNSYIKDNFARIEANHGSVLNRLMEYITRYPKYNKLLNRNKLDFIVDSYIAKFDEARVQGTLFYSFK